MQQVPSQSVTQVPKAQAKWRAVAGLLLVSAGNLAGAQGVPDTGFKIMAATSGGNCLACHSLPQRLGQSSSQRVGQSDGMVSSFGPPLAQVGSRYNAAELRQWVFDARQIKPGTLMPPFGTTSGTHLPQPAKPILSDEDIAHVVAALQTLR